MEEHVDPKFKPEYSQQAQGLFFFDTTEKRVLVNIKDNTKIIKNDRYSSSIRNFLKEVFLPQGYPDSVHSDYLPYQIWDTLQASASTILGTLTTQSIMTVVGVGEATATPLAAAITWILKDGTGMVGRIVFAWWSGPELDAQCKKWRLFADVLNDLAMGVELMLPYFSNYSTLLLCFSTGMRSLVGVAGGATRTSITQHQALKNNLADVSAKDGSQETCVNLIASLIGVFMLSYLNASSYVGFWFLVLATIHIYANYRAVTSLRFNTFNEDRLAILVKNYLTTGTIASPNYVNDHESILIFRRGVKKLCGFDIVIGKSLDKYKNITKGNTSDTDLHSQPVQSLKSDSYQELPNLIFTDVENQRICIALYHGVKNDEIVQTYFEAFLRGVYLTIRWTLQPNIVEEAKHSLGPLSNVYKMAVDWKSNNDDLDAFVKKESINWMYQLENSDWAKETNLLPIGSYRLHEVVKALD